MKRLKDFLNVRAVWNNYYEAQAKLQEMTEGGRLGFFEKGMKLNGEIGGMMIKTSPFPPEMEHQRVDAAVDVVKQIYGSVDAYKGIWIASGCLDEGVAPEKQQRQMLVDRLLEKGVSVERIRESGGRDSFGNVEESLSIITDEKIRSLGVSSYSSHIQRFALIFDYFIRKDMLSENFTVVGIATPYALKHRFSRKMGFGVYDFAAIVKEQGRLRSLGVGSGK